MIPAVKITITEVHIMLRGIPNCLSLIFKVLAEMVMEILWSLETRFIPPPPAPATVCW